ncbi:chemotaxis protein CheW [Pseudoroseomonas cervicalis]|uniref:chemotaxis protein CheW n=1 Tax=Teichococcus cervicalis TaxID=204525 RepID=UPI0022F1766B|nr:chemotaxis protein CheW [Pseudoroseomonas cervicalis]WBV45369.1 chemotaxis protein CheW [Pseudoroseomonas cervicalis]
MPHRDRAGQAAPAAGLPSMAAQAERLLELRTRQLAARRGQREATPRLPPVLACAVGEALYGVPLTAVARVLPAGPLAPLPGGLPAMLGLYGHAGQVHAVIDLGLALGAAAGHGLPAEGHLLLLREAPRRFALHVGRVLTVTEPLPLAGAAAAQAAAERPAGRALSGHALLPGERGAPPRLMGLVALERLLLPFRAEAPAADDPAADFPISADQPLGQPSGA